MLMKKTSYAGIYANIVCLFLGCSATDEPQNTYLPDFEISQHATDANVFVFKNTTQGEHYYWLWDFGNGDRTSRNPVEEKEMECFFPEAGTYEVELTIWGNASDLSDNKKVIKQVVVENDVFIPSFVVTKVDGKTNTYQLSNTTTGDFDEITWIVVEKEIEDSQQMIDVYFPFCGTYEVVMMVVVGEYEKSIQQSIRISGDDDDYMSHYSLVWNDEFEGSSLDTDKWLLETGAHGWGNSEWQNYTDGDNVVVSDGTLKIMAKKTGDGQKAGDYTSARLNSKSAFTYGIYEVRAKLPEDKGPGVWPAIWMLGESIQNGTNWPLCGEIDIMEYVSWDPNNTSGSIHIESNNHAKGNAIGSGHLPFETAEEQFHTYGLIWTEGFVRLYRDDVNNTILTYKKPGNANQENWPFDQPFYYLLNIAVGGSYGGVDGVDDAVFPTAMEVDFARVYQLN